MTILIDTGVFYAFLVRGDEHHEQAVELVRALGEGQHGVPLTSDYVVDEVMTLIRKRQDPPELEVRARRLLPFPEPGLPGLGLATVSPQQVRETMETFERYRDQGLSFTDASHLVLMDRYEIDRLATFDTGFEGLVDVVPEAG